MPAMLRVPLFVSLAVSIACEKQRNDEPQLESSSENNKSSEPSPSHDSLTESTIKPDSSSEGSTSDTTTKSEENSTSSPTSSDSESSETDVSPSDDNETIGETSGDTLSDTLSVTSEDTIVDSSDETGPATDTAGDSDTDDTGASEDTDTEDDIGVFIAQGHMARTTISCDGGRTWVANESMDDTVRCFENDFDCDHHLGSATGLGYGNGWFVASYGWGTPGEIRRSRNGVNWEAMVKEGLSVAKIAYGNEIFMAGNYRPVRGDNEAEVWENLADSKIDDYTVRGIGFAPISGGRFYLGAKANVLYSSDKGESWTFPQSRPEDCGDSMKGLAYGNGTLVMTSPPVLCYSTDGGDNWHAKNLKANSAPIWTGTKFMAWSQSQGFSSSDGVNWTSHDLSPSSVKLGPVAMDDQGTFVSSSGGWKIWYEKQDFYRSDDGINWEAIDKSKFVPSHPILNIVFARIKGPSPCP